MKQKPIIIDSVLGGQSNLWNGSRNGQFLTSVGIDPEQQLNDTIVKTSGVINPIVWAKFSSTNISGTPKWIITQPKIQKFYVYADDGKFVSYTDLLGTETLVGTPTSGAGNGAAYYNNYIYLATPTNVSRYGPLTSSPAIENLFWAGSATFLNKTATVDTGYLPNASNHPMHTHVDGALYFGDFDGTSSTASTRGRGLIHKICTQYGTMNSVTNEGTADNTTTPSAYGALKLPYGYAPYAICSYGTDLAILANIIGNDQVMRQGNSSLFLWDTFSSSFYRQVALPFSAGTALLNHNGTLYLWGGDDDRNYGIYQYLGGYTVQMLEFFLGASPPRAGAVDGIGSRITWGTNSTYPNTGGHILTRGYINGRLPNSAINDIGKVSASGVNTYVTAVKYVQQTAYVPKPIAGWNDSTSVAFGIDKSTTGTYNSLWRSQVFNIGRPFIVDKIKIPLGAAVAANMTVTPKIYCDNELTNTTLTVINNTNFPNSEKSIAIYPQVHGEYNFYLELAFTGTVALPINLPITIEYSTKQD